MNVENYIESGTLEMYLAGQLDEKENLEVAQNMQDHDAIQTEAEALENDLILITAAIHDINPPAFESWQAQLNSKAKSNNTGIYLAWAATLLIAISSIFWMFNKLTDAENQLASNAALIDSLEQNIQRQQKEIQKTDELFAEIGAKEVLLVPLAGQSNFEETYAKVYWNKKSNKIYVDASGLPEAPEGKVYQLWSLTLDPLSPTSLGLLAELSNVEDRFFAFDNPNASEAFGITLEDEGGSPTPTLDQLYTLGVVKDA